MKGDFGENLASTLISQWTEQGQLFETTCIGGKWPTIDIYAEIRTQDDQRAFCFFQVKSTVSGYTSRGKQKLKIKVSKEDLNNLSNFNAPTYLIGVDYNRNNPQWSRCYVKVVRGTYNKGLTGIETNCQLNAANLLLLKEEVEVFWSSLNSLEKKLTYKTNF